MSKRKKDEASTGGVEDYAAFAEALADALPRPLSQEERENYLAEIKLAVLNPREYDANHVVQMNQGLWEDEQLPWVALTNSLQREGQQRAFSLDNKFGVDQCSFFVAECLGRDDGATMWKTETWIPEEEEEESGPMKYLARVSASLNKNHKVTLLWFNHDSDDFDLVPVWTKSVPRLVAACERLGEQCGVTDTKDLSDEEEEGSE